MSDFKTLDRTATSQYGLLTTAQLLAAGFTERQIKRRLAEGSLVRSHKGVLAVAGAPSTWEQQLSAAVLAGRAVCAASHRSAARLWGFRTSDDNIELSVRYPRRVVIAGATVHRSRDLLSSDITWIEGIAVTTPERTVCDLGLVFPEHEVARVLRQAISVGLVNRREAWRIRYRNSKQGRNGVGILGTVLADLAEHAELTESGLEGLFLTICQQFGIDSPVAQFPVVAAGHHYRLDFAYPQHRLFIEIDGAEFHAATNQIANDDSRQNHLVAAGWRPVRFTYDQLRNKPGSCIQVLRRLLDL